MDTLALSIFDYEDVFTVAPSSTPEAEYGAFAARDLPTGSTIRLQVNHRQHPTSWMRRTREHVQCPRHSNCIQVFSGLSLGSWLNHSEKPNGVLVILESYYVCYRPLVDIKKGTELTIHYTCNDKDPRAYTANGFKVAPSKIRHVLGAAPKAGS